jgi:hypothetical protein
MKILVTESQYRKILGEEKEQKILRVPGLNFFHENPFEAWQILQKVLERRGNPPYSIGGDLDLSGTPIKSLGNLISVEGDLNLYDTPIRSLENLKSVRGFLYLDSTPIESLGNLTSVGGDLDLSFTSLSEKHTEEEIRQMVDVGGEIYLLIY